MAHKLDCPNPKGHYVMDKWENLPCGSWTCPTCGIKNWKYIYDIIIDNLGIECRLLTLKLGASRYDNKILKVWRYFYITICNKGLKFDSFVWIRTYDKELKEILHVFIESKVDSNILKDLWEYYAGKGYYFDDKIINIGEELVNIGFLLSETVKMKKILNIKDRTKLYGLSSSISEIRNIDDEEHKKNLAPIEKVILGEHESITHPDHIGIEEIVCLDIDTGKCYSKKNRPLTIKDMLDAQLEKYELDQLENSGMKPI